ncbi:MAG: tyrosine-type recombinase/integrase [Planctomycetaceae bacterium]|nr:tyrosine-type recombinase/integrase [Planctomycetaceae bacterium]
MASVSFDRKNNQWKVYWKHKGARGSKAFRSEQEARDYQCGLERAIKASVQWVLIDAALPQWVAYAQKFTRATQAHYFESMDAFLDSAKKSYLQELGMAELNGYVAMLHTRGVKNRTVNARLTAIRSFAKWAAGQYRIPNFCLGFESLAEDPPTQRFLTPEELTCLLSHGTPLLRQRALFLANTGLRASEFCNLTFGDVLPNNMLRVLGKGRKRRHVPLNLTCQSILSEIEAERPNRKPGDYIFLSKSGLKLDKKKLYNQFQHVAENAKLEAFGAHAFRHFFATQLLTNGVDIAKVSRLLGHSSIRTTERIYIHWQPGHLQGLTNSLEVFDNRVDAKNAG